jgi:hypothetical protein
LVQAFKSYKGNAYSDTQTTMSSHKPTFILFLQDGEGRLKSKSKRLVISVSPQALSEESYSVIRDGRIYARKGVSSKFDLLLTILFFLHIIYRRLLCCMSALLTSSVFKLATSSLAEE